MEIGYKQDASIVQERIRARYQTTFWKEFIAHFASFGSEAHKFEMIKKFESVFVKLIEQIIKNFEINPDDSFMQFNYLESIDDAFTEHFNNQRDLGKVLREATKLLGVEQVVNILKIKLEAAVQFA